MTQLSPRRERIVYTRPDGGVSIAVPSANCLRWMCLGGRWADMPRGFVDEQTDRQIAAGIPKRAAAAFSHALAFGGLTDREALEVLRDRDCAPHGSGIELWDMDEVPSDRWFRNAWTRSHNGGPIYIDLGKAKYAQFARVRDAIDLDHRRRARDLNGERLDIDIDGIRQRIREARDVESVRRAWPDGLGVAYGL